MTRSLSRASHASVGGDQFKITIPYSPQDGVNAPTALPLLPGGAMVQGRDGRAYKHPGPLKTLQAMEQAFKDLPMILDENHSSEFAAPNGEPSPALARMRGFAMRADGSIWATEIDWTPYGLQRIAQRAYLGVSPTILFDRTQATEQDGVRIEGEILSIENAGLVNQPNFVMPALHSKEHPKMDEAAIKKMIEDALKAATAPFAALKDELTAKFADMQVQFTAAVEGQKQEAAASHAKRVEKALDRATHAKKIAPSSRAYHAKRLITAEDLSEFEESFLSGVSEDVVSNERPARGTHSKKGTADKTAARLSKDMGVDLADLEAEDEE